MKAIIQSGFGTPGDVLTLGTIDEPTVGDGGVLLRVRAASIHIGDVYGIRGLPKVMRPVFRSMRANNGVVGTDIAGTVEAVGGNVTDLHPGDEVFGWCKGAFAEYAAAEEKKLALKPNNITWEHAATIGVSAFTALQALRDRGKVQAGQSVLIVGASGGVGTFAVQLAKLSGAEVTGVCSPRNIELVRSLGADHVVDYTRQDFTRSDRKYDLILDNVGVHSLKDTRRALKPNGILLANGAPAPAGWFGGLGRPLQATIVSMFVKQQGRSFLSTQNAQDLATLKELAEAGEISPAIDRVVPLGEGIEAISRVGEGHNRGTTVMTM